MTWKKYYNCQVLKLYVQLGSHNIEIRSVWKKNMSRKTNIWYDLWWNIFIGHFYVLECSTGFYGEQCGSKCDHCLNDTACDHITGYCLKGCEPGYQGINCTIGKWYYHQIIITKHIHVYYSEMFFFLNLASCYVTEIFVKQIHYLDA